VRGALVVLVVLAAPLVGLISAGSTAVAQGDEVEFRTLEEGFEGQPFLDLPNSAISKAEGGYFGSVASGGASDLNAAKWFVTDANPRSGESALFYDDDNVDARTFLNFDSTRINYCLGGSMEFWIRPTAFPVGEDTIIGLVNAGTTKVSFRITPAGEVKPAVVGASETIGASLGTMSLDQYYHLKVDQINCGTAVARFTSTTLGSTVWVDAAGSLSNVWTFAVITSDTGVLGNAQYTFDDFNFTYVWDDSGKWIFCSDPGATNFAYTFKEDISPGTSGTKYLFTGHQGNFAYLAKGFTTPSKALQTYFKIEAQVEGSSSVFRTFYSFDAGTPSSSTKGNGGNEGETATGLFANGVQVRFQESSNQWRITIDQFVAGVRTEVGPSTYVAGPNKDQLFSFVVDTRTGTPFVELRDADGKVIIKRSFGATVGTVHSDFIESTMKSQWFVGYGTSAFRSSRTELARSAGSSTCIFDLTGAAVVEGAEGTRPDNANAPGATLGPGGAPGSGIGALGPSIPGSGGRVSSLVWQWSIPFGLAAVAYKVSGGGYSKAEGYRPGSPVFIGSAFFVGMCIAVIAFGLSKGFVILVGVFSVAAIIFGIARYRSGAA